jgi:tetratricopeptide (TPR) repeat protein
MMKRVLILFVVMGLTMSVLRAQGPDEEYIRIYNLIQQGDTLQQNGQMRDAYGRFLEAQAALKQFQTVNPSWETKLIQFRLNYVAAKVRQFAPAPALVLEKEPPKPLTPREWQEKVQALTGEAKQLAVDKTLLEGKLREALAAQPTTVDPREVAKAEEKIRALQKDNELLRTSLKQAENKAAKTTGSPAASEAKSLADAKNKLAEQVKMVAALKEEKAVLEKRVKSREDRSVIRSLKAENESLQKQLTEVKKQVSAATAASGLSRAEIKQIQRLQAENESLQKQLSKVTKQVPVPAPSRAEVTQGQRLQAENESLQKQLSEVRKRLATVASAPGASRAEVKQIQRLEAERADLQKKLATAQQELKQRGTGQTAHLNRQITALTARLEVLEAKKTPYSPEELALFKQPIVPVKQPEVIMTAAEPAEPSSPTTPSPFVKPAKKSLKDLPVGAGPLVAEAQRAFAAGRPDEAELKYQQVLRLDDKNVFTLGNLAAIQLERNKLAEAEANLKKAIEIDPDDAYNLSLMGILRFRQDNYDEALTVLSRSAKLDPDNAETQNYLGIVLSQKGQREAAEAALRRAVQLAPNNRDAHHNLAVVYARQNPPFPALARFHYQKALAAGHARNPELEKLLEPAAAK